MWYAIVFIISAAMVFFGGLLVGRNNPKIADKASELADKCVDAAKDKIKG